MRKEIELLARVQECGSVVHLHGVYESESHIYIVMELCLGGDLERILEVSWAQAQAQAWEHACIQLSRPTSRCLAGAQPSRLDSAVAATGLHRGSCMAGGIGGIRAAGSAASSALRSPRQVGSSGTGKKPAADCTWKPTSGQGSTGGWAEPCCASLQDRGPFSERQTAAVLYECLKVISTCHTNGMTHGDVKPAVRWPLHMELGHDLQP